MPSVTTTRCNLAWTLLVLRNGSVPTMQDAPACSLGAILATLAAIAGSTITACTVRGFDDLLADVLATANGGTLPTISESPPYSLEKILWNLCIVENGSVPTLHAPMNCSDEEIMANLVLSTGGMIPLRWNNTSVKWNDTTIKWNATLYLP